MSLEGKTVLITGAAVRVGRAMALAVARAGGDVALHYGSSQAEALALRAEIQALGRQAHLLQADLSESESVQGLVPAARQHGPLFALVNSAAIFEPLDLRSTSLEAWERHLAINLTAPFLLCQSFADALEPGQASRIVNILDWRALRPGGDHLAYTISKAGLAALTRYLAISLAPQVTVNALALGAILPPGTGEPPPDLIRRVPAGRWAQLSEVGEALLFLLDGPTYITGEILHLDGGRHLV
ncbi:MAG TPA: SDR family oxidoreductase [Anaerolineales bacterium]|nr:SDR family oxidoreductase [Anaerolineales bacterium]